MTDNNNTPSIGQTRHERLVAQNAKLSIVGKKTAKEWRILIAIMMGFIAQGLSEDEIIAEMGLRNVKDYNDIRKRMYEQETARHTDRSNAQLFIDYIINQRMCLEDLDVAIKKYKDTNQANAIVGAIRAKSDIIDKITRRGEELGVLRKENDGIKIVAGIDVSALSNFDIKLKIKAELQAIHNITQGPIIDVTPDIEDDILIQPSLAIPPMVDQHPEDGPPVRRKR
jgi:hypothetical protein